MLDKKIRIAVFVSGGGTNLQALMDAQKSGIIKSGEIVLVISNKENVYALQRAQQNNIKAVTIVKDKEETVDAFENKILKCLEENNIEFIVFAGFLAILTERITRKYPNRIINIHPSLIPSFCGKGYYGLKVHEAALNYGVKVTGATVHFVNEVADGGKIIAQKAVYIKEGDTPEILQKRVMEEAEWVLLPQATEDICKKLLEEKNEG
jgi:phosphoribosylglycinamide formyltransferase 1